MKIKPLDNPNYLASGYTLHLYCKWLNEDHRWDEFPHEYFDQHGPTTYSNARKAGWIIHKDRTATCPKCAKELKRG